MLIFLAPFSLCRDQMGFYIVQIVRQPLIRASAVVRRSDHGIVKPRFPVNQLHAVHRECQASPQDQITLAVIGDHFKADVFRSGENRSDNRGAFLRVFLRVEVEVFDLIQLRPRALLRVRMAVSEKQDAPIRKIQAIVKRPGPLAPTRGFFQRPRPHSPLIQHKLLFLQYEKAKNEQDNPHMVYRFLYALFQGPYRNKFQELFLYNLYVVVSKYKEPLIALISFVGLVVPTIHFGNIFVQLVNKNTLIVTKNIFIYLFIYFYLTL